MYLSFLLMQILLKLPNGKCLAFDVMGSITVQELKKMIQDSQNLPIDTQKLIYQGRPLSDVESMAGIGLVEDSMLYLIIVVPKAPSAASAAEITVYIKYSPSSTVEYTIPSTATVADLKIKISAKDGRPTSDFILYHGQDKLVETSTLVDSKVKDETTLLLAIVNRGGH